MACVLELKQISKSFPGVNALQEVSFSLEAGKVHAVVGENGAGKSTLIKIIAGVYQPGAGTIFLNGNQVNIATPNEAHRLGISVIYQETSLFPDLSVMENLFIGREPVKGFLKAIQYKKMKEEAKEIFDSLETEIDMEEKVSFLGIAQKQMVEIAKALSFRSRILIMDEPTAALSQKEVKALFGIISLLKERGVAIIYISHRLEEIYEIADRVTVLRDGTYIATAPVKEVDNRKLIAWMVGRPLDSYFPKTKADIGATVLLVKDLRQTGVLQDINLELHRGEILGISGLASSGRTELAQALTGFAPPDSGEILIENRKVHFRNYSEAVARGIIYVSEDRGKLGLVLPMKVKENVTLSMLKNICRFGFIDFKEEERICNQFISQLQIRTPGPDFTVANLSGGNQQKVSVSRALATRPKVLILDEPTRGVDVGAKAEIYKIISQLAGEGLAIIMISSELPEILGMSDRIIVMRKGRFAGEFSREEATQQKIIALALGVA
jgi:ABC-type sugar transport system ATPase subunit